MLTGTARVQRTAQLRGERRRERDRYRDSPSPITFSNTRASFHSSFLLFTAAASAFLSDMAGAGPTAQYRVDPDGVAVITLTNPPVNALHPAGELASTLLLLC